MPKEKSINPAQAARKAEKAKAIKKGKATLQAQKNERLAKKNPFHLQKQLDELKTIETSGGKLTSHKKGLVDGLEKEIRAVKKAREAAGINDDATGDRGRGAESRGGSSRGGFGERGRGAGRGGAVLGKRRRDDVEGGSSESEEVDEDVKRIPMPRDTPPPIPKVVLDKWYAARRAKRNAIPGGNANSEPLGGKNRGEFGSGDGERGMGKDNGHTKEKNMEVKTVYEAKPQIRDLRKEATAFVPAAVRAKMMRGKGEGGLIEEDEAERLEREGYLKTGGGSGDSKNERANSDGGAEMNVEMEEVEDEDA